MVEGKARPRPETGRNTTDEIIREQERDFVAN